MHFRLGVAPVSQTGTWVSGGIIELPLNASSPNPTRNDLDGDGKMDIITYRQSTGWWYGLESGAGYAYPYGFFSMQWGEPSQGDIPVSGDLDGDGKMDIITYRQSTGWWYGLKSASGYAYPDGFFSMQWGEPGQGDIPVSGDLDGDGKMDIIIYRQSTGWWYGLKSANGYAYPDGFFSMQWGEPGQGDMPVSGDLDGDGKMDIIIYRQSNGWWYGLGSANEYAYPEGYASYEWGDTALGDVPIQ